MPIYEYKCPECGKFEGLRGVGCSATPCPSCQSMSNRVPSLCIIKQFARMDQADGEGFTTRWTSNDELKEQRRGQFLGQS